MTGRSHKGVNIWASPRADRPPAQCGPSARRLLHLWPGTDVCGLLLCTDGCSFRLFEDGSNAGVFFMLGRLEPFIPAVIILFLSARESFPRDPALLWTRA